MKRLLMPLAALAMTLYLIVALSFTYRNAAERRCEGLHIVVRDSATHPFVTAGELARELGSLPARLSDMRLAQVNTDSIESLFESIDKIESVKVVTLTDGHILVDVEPMKPVARVFPDKGRSFYINRAGKTIAASARYHMDVPVIRGTFRDTTFTPSHLLPLIDYLEAYPSWGALVSSIKADSPSDIILIPVIRGHVVNLGDLSALDSKFSRLSTFYKEVMPNKGWDAYDTISLKWAGQAVATRRIKHLPTPPSVEDVEEEVDTNTMIGVDSVRMAPTKFDKAIKNR
ncbi:MAG: hypothetical protein NC342_07825 [Pseudoflavonifractor sp.]|nr:hypothetical protein [Pseudoflavonifractor sp.]